MLTDNPQDLKKGLQIASEFGKKWICGYNAKKTQVVLFGKNRKIKLEWSIGSQKIEQVESYKYLGIEIEDKLKWSLFKKGLLEKAIGLWKALVLPILEYAAEIWGDRKWEEAEILQRTIAKRILGVYKRTSNEAVLGDLGWWPLKARRDMIRLRYLQNLLNMNKKRLPKQIYEWEKEKKEDSK